MLWQIILTAAGIFCLAYYGLICVTLGKWDSTFSRFWVMAGIVLIVMGQVSENSGARFPLFLILAAATGIFVFTQIRIILGMYAGAKKKCTVVIVLGAHVEGRRISESLKKRLDRAYEYYTGNPDLLLIVSGGKGRGEEITEAEAMKKYLLYRGIPSGNIVCEDRSTTTKENLIYSGRLIQNREMTVGIVTNNFHMYRASAIARRLGYSSIVSIPCGCPPVLFINYMVREFFAVWKMWLCR